jgi:hypothetical protein
VPLHPSTECCKGACNICPLSRIELASKWALFQHLIKLEASSPF